MTNPPLDAIREELVTSCRPASGPRATCSSRRAASCRRSSCPYPVIDNDELAKLLYVNEHGETPGFKAFAIDGLFDPTGGGDALRRGASRSVAPHGSSIGHRRWARTSSSSRTATPTPTWPRSRRCCSTAAVHHHLVREKTRTRVGLVVETGEAREVHHIALLIGYGAAAVNPYLAFETIDDMIADGSCSRAVAAPGPRPTTSRRPCKGVIKIMSKMGISTVASYTGAQVFEAVGLARDVVDGTSPAPPAASAGSAST